MDPYATLGVSRHVNRAELKKAYRKEAMKWHPDRAGESAQAKERFQQICLAYRELSERLKQSVHGNAGSTDHQTDGGYGDQDDVFDEMMLEYAISLAQTGHGKAQITDNLIDNGCVEKSAKMIAQRAIRFQRDLTETCERRRDRQAAGRRMLTEKFDYGTVQALLGQNDPNARTRQRISDYLEALNAFSGGNSNDGAFGTSKNRYLNKVFNRSMLLFLLLSAMAFFFPNTIQHSPLQLIDLFQLPHMVLALMLVWSAYHRLWLLSSLNVCLLAIAQATYYKGMPWAIEQDYLSLLLIAAASYVLFLLPARFSNLFLYHKARAIVDSVNHQYPDLPEKHLLIRNRGGVSRRAALIMATLLAAYFLHVIPQDSSLPQKIAWALSIDNAQRSRELVQMEAQVNQAADLFDVAERHFYSDPPAYAQARLAYRIAASNGSVLAAYKLGYMYLTGIGAKQDEHQALRYFSQAVNSSLAAQPHDLAIATRWLAESYFSLGVMHLGGYGTEKSSTRAMEMFRHAIKYDPTGKINRLVRSGKLTRTNLKSVITRPDFSD